MRKLMAVAALVLLIALAGCATHNQTKLDDAGQVDLTTSTASASRMDSEGNQSAAHQGMAPTLSKVDSDGIWRNAPGIEGTIAYVTDAAKLFMASPRDVEMKNVELSLNPTDGQPVFKAEFLSMNVTEPLKQHTESLKTAAETLKAMTQAEALAQIERWRVLGEIAPDVLDLLAAVIVPLLAP